ncbi:Hypothetical predicted protein [Olea europaea subsp. europaea]|uniref:Uncharacterized protein n=1 Tax=Olea europaea subsp. europaea TaxID=158383 RepID=A0A8S0UIF2_OLEEU|nr:Hypothetical predicted protein [Olea europaea subsp. europaea]
MCTVFCRLDQLTVTPPTTIFSPSLLQIIKSQHQNQTKPNQISRLLHTTAILATSTHIKPPTTTAASIFRKLIFKKLGRATLLLMMIASRSVQPPSQHRCTNAQAASDVCCYECWCSVDDDTDAGEV